LASKHICINPTKHAARTLTRTPQAFLVQDSLAARAHLEERQRERLLLRRRREGAARTLGDVELARAPEGGAAERAWGRGRGRGPGGAWIEWRKPTMFGQRSYKARSPVPLRPRFESRARSLAAPLASTRPPLPHVVAHSLALLANMLLDCLTHLSPRVPVGILVLKMHCCINRACLECISHIFSPSGFVCSRVCLCSQRF
jgi:hypothetical protein